MTRSVLVTGAGGLVGSALVERLLTTPCRLRLLVRTRIPPAALRPDVEVIRGDVRDRAVLERALAGVDVVFHLAAQTSARAADRDAEADWEVNLEPVLRILEWLRRRRRRAVVVLVGSETQAGLPLRRPLDESVPDRPLGVYELHKLMAEQYLEHHARAGIVAGACLRLPTVYGAGPQGGARDRGLVNAAVRQALGGGPLSAYGGGAFVRDFLHVSDVAAALLLAAEHADRLGGRHFLVGTGRGVPIADALELIAAEVHRRTGRPVAVEPVGPPPGWTALDERDVVVDASAFSRLTGWAPAVSLEDGIAATVSAVAGEGSPAGERP